MSTTPTHRGDTTLVIGAGPAGLATARALAARGLPYDQVERNEGVGGIWDIDAPGSPMYEAAHLISSRTLSGFPGFPMGEHLPDYPDHRQVLGYLRDFAAAYRLADRVETGRSVSALDRDGDGYRVTLDDGEQRRYAAVVCCSGAQWTPRMPEVPAAFTGEVWHSKEYRDLDQLRGRRVLVIGGGNSACDIVVDAARTAERAVISMRRGYWFIPKHVFGMPSDVFAARGPHLPKRIEQAVFGFVLNTLYGRPERLGLPAPDHRVFETHPVLNSNLADRRDDPAVHRKFRSMVRHERPDLSGGIRFDDSPRHAGYVDADALTAFRREVVGRMAWRTEHGTPAPALTAVPA